MKWIVLICLTDLRLAAKERVIRCQRSKNWGLETIFSLGALFEIGLSDAAIDLLEESRRYPCRYQKLDSGSRMWTPTVQFTPAVFLDPHHTLPELDASNSLRQ